MKRSNFYITYMADETLPLNKCHKGLEKFSTRKRNRFFDITDEGLQQGMKFFNECKFPITKEKSLLFLKSKKEGIKVMNAEKQKIAWSAIIEEPITLELNKPNIIPLKPE